MVGYVGCGWLVVGYGCFEVFAGGPGNCKFVEMVFGELKKTDWIG